MRYSANLLLSLLCAAVCTAPALAADLPSTPHADCEDALAAAQPTPEESAQIEPEESASPEPSTDTDAEEPAVPDATVGTDTDESVPPDTSAEVDAEEPGISVDPDMDDRFLIPSEPEETDTPAEPPSIVLTRFDTQTAFDLTAVPVGGEASLHAFFDSLRTGLCGYDADGTAYDFVTGEWNLSAIDLSTPGLYYASAPLLLVDENNVPCFTLSDGVTAPEVLCRVSVQQAGKPDIREFFAARGWMIFPWVLTDEQQEQLDQFSIWLQPENGVWAPVSTNCYSLTDSELYFRPQSCGLLSGSTYSIQVDYPGGQTGILTFVYDDTPLKTGYAEGSHDGGGENTTLPDVIQPAPSHSGGSHHTSKPSKPTLDPVQPENPIEQPIPELPSDDTAPLPDEPPAVSPTEPTPSTAVPEITIPMQPVLRAQTADTRPEPIQSAPQASSVSQASSVHVEPAPAALSAPVIERDTADEAILSGTRLLALIELDEPLLLTKDGITLSVSADALRALHLTQTDTLSVALTHAQDGAAQAVLLLNGAPLDTIPGMTLSDDFAPVETQMQSTDQPTAASSASTVPIHTPHTPASPLPFAAAGAAVLAGAACLLRWRKRS